MGVEEDDEGKPRLPVKGIPFERGLDLRVVNIILENITPPIFPEVGVVNFAGNDSQLAVLVIRVHQSNEAPHAIDNKRRIYLRTDNRNRQEELATIEQIEWLLNKRRRSEELREQTYAEAIKRLDNLYKNGFLEKDYRDIPVPKGQGIFSICPLYPKEPLIGVQDLKSLCSGPEVRVRDYLGSLSSFPSFDREPRTTQNGVIGYMLEKGNETIRSYFYEFNVFGLFLFQEIFGWKSEQEKAAQQTTATNSQVWVENIVSHLDLFLEVAQRFYERIGVWGLVKIRVELNDIFSLHVRRPCRVPFWDDKSRVSHQDRLEVARVITFQELKESRIQVLDGMVQEIGLAFNYDLRGDFVQDYLRNNKRI